MSQPRMQNRGDESGRSWTDKFSDRRRRAFNVIRKIVFKALIVTMEEFITQHFKYDSVRTVIGTFDA
jgi:hypothetical protein